MTVLGLSCLKYDIVNFVAYCLLFVKFDASMSYDQSSLNLLVRGPALAANVDKGELNMLNRGFMVNMWPRRRGYLERTILYTMLIVY